jgi:hypothetical protein
MMEGEELWIFRVNTHVFYLEDMTLRVDFLCSLIKEYCNIYDLDFRPLNKTIDFRPLNKTMNCPACHGQALRIRKPSFSIGLVSLTIHVL